MASVSHLMGSGLFLKFSTDDIYFSYLPLAHQFEHLLYQFCLYLGTPIVFATSIDLVVAELPPTRPTFLCLVPKKLKVFRDKVEAKFGIFKIILNFIISLPTDANFIFRWIKRLLLTPIRAKLSSRAKVLFILNNY